jgi:hypothetical protein
MKPMKPVHRRYHEYICKLIPVGEEHSCHSIRVALRDYTPELYVKRNRPFHHKELPNTQVLSYILRVSPNFIKSTVVRKGHDAKEQLWRRIQ